MLVEVKYSLSHIHSHVVNHAIRILLRDVMYNLVLDTIDLFLKTNSLTFGLVLEFIDSLSKGKHESGFSLLLLNCL